MAWSGGGGVVTCTSMSQVSSKVLSDHKLVAGSPFSNGRRQADLQHSVDKAQFCGQTPLAQDWSTADKGRLHHHEQHPGRLQNHEQHPYLLPSKLFFVGLGGELSG